MRKHTGQTHALVMTLTDSIIVLNRVLLYLSLLLLFFLFWDLFIDHSFHFLFESLYAFLWLCFILEFGVHIFLSKHKVRYVVENLFVVFIIMFPFLRPLSLFPLSRWGLLIFAETASERLPVFRKYRILEIILFSIVLTVLSADIFLLVERGEGSLFKNFGDALWFSVVTVATVGYGDIYPKTTFGRILASILIVFGISIFGIVTASISSYLVERDLKEDYKDEKRTLKRVKREEESIENKLVNMDKNEQALLDRLTSIERRLM